MLTTRNLQAGYGKSQVLRGVDLHVDEGEIVALLGRNGSGRSTTAKAVMGLLPSEGEVLWKGQPVRGLPAFALAQRGLGYVPESRDVFPGLTVHHNLQLGVKSGSGARRWSFDDIYRLFPQLRVRQDTQAGVLSGGEQQMLTLGRTLMGDPDLVIIDEPTEGLAPQVVGLVAEFLKEMRERGVSVLLIEQKLSIALAISDRCLVMGHGRIVFEGLPSALHARPDIRREWLEV